MSLADCVGGAHWRLKLDTNLSDAPAAYRGAPGDRYGITERSLILFIAVPAGVR